MGERHSSRRSRGEAWTRRRTPLVKPPGPSYLPTSPLALIPLVTATQAEVAEKLDKSMVGHGLHMLSLPRPAAELAAPPSPHPPSPLSALPQAPSAQAESPPHPHPPSGQPSRRSRPSPRTPRSAALLEEATPNAPPTAPRHLPETALAALSPRRAALPKVSPSQRSSTNSPTQLPGIASRRPRAPPPPGSKRDYLAAAMLLYRMRPMLPPEDVEEEKEAEAQSFRTSATASFRSTGRNRRNKWKGDSGRADEMEHVELASSASGRESLPPDPAAASCGHSASRATYLTELPPYE